MLHDYWDWYLAGIAVLFLQMTWSQLRELRWAQRLPSRSDLPVLSAEPRVSVVIAARDEASRLPATLDRLLAQQEVLLEIIVVDDRSRDETPQILTAYVQAHAVVKYLRIEVLPDGWLGKCHACHQGANLATGDWILFTDADCWLKPDTLVRALRVAQREHADHITLTPGVAPQTALARAWHLTFLITLLSWLRRVNTDHPKAFLGMGAFNLMRREAYEQCGGYEALRLTVVDDIKLGLLLRRAGKRTRGFIGGDDVECHWGATVGHMIQVMEKNYFAALDYRTVAVFGLLVVTTLIWGGTLFGLVSGRLTGVAAAVSALFLAIPGARLARKLNWHPGTGCLVPFTYFVLIFAIANSTWRTLRQRGIYWRDTFYPLKMLREGNVQ
jgi:glycosyltransferase involved in cell wall biosynthesis